MPVGLLPKRDIPCPKATEYSLPALPASDNQSFIGDAADFASRSRWKYLSSRLIAATRKLAATADAHNSANGTLRRGWRNRRGIAAGAAFGTGGSSDAGPFNLMQCGS
jgi:hypothetical protein